MVTRGSDLPGVDGPFERLVFMARQRSVLTAPFASAVARHGEATCVERDAWAGAVLRLANANVGALALTTFLWITAREPSGPAVLYRLGEVADAAAELGRRAGAAAVHASLAARADLARRPAPFPVDAEAAWWRALIRLAREAPDCVTVLAGTSDRILARCGARHIEDFVLAGLRSANNRDKRRTFFALEAADAHRVLDRLAGEVTFRSVEGQLRLFVTALWGRPYPLRELVDEREEHRPRRAAVSTGVLLLPHVLRGVPAPRATMLYRAGVAHASAHLALGRGPFEPGSLKPIQIVLVGLIEDARIEMLAMRRLPGLRRVWAPFHTVEPSHLKTAPLILARLARALFDPDYRDDDAIVAKGRALFAAEPTLDDPGLSRRIGNLLGNDIGQMRIQFDARSFVIEPPYRDDNLGLWALPPPPPDGPSPLIDVDVQAVRVAHQPADPGEAPDRHEPDKAEGAGRARPVGPDERGLAVALYPEWDRAAGLDRPYWVTVREREQVLGIPEAIDDALVRDAGLQRRIERLVRRARAGRPTRLRRQPDGIDLDIDAAIDAVVARRAGEHPEDRLHTRKVLRLRDLAVLVLVDTSESTRDRATATGSTILDVEKLAVAVLAQSLDALGDRFALRAFSSDGREDVRIVRVKDFDQAFDRAAKARLAGLQPGFSTRLGAALRHAGAELDRLAATRRIVIALTDGTPSDIDVTEPGDLVADARRAVTGLHHRGIDVFGITLDPSGEGDGPTVFGRANHMPVRRIEDLPNRLSELYFRIAQR